MRYSNCLIFALMLWRRQGGYLIVRKSRYTWVPHFMWAKTIEGLDIVEYKPVNPKRGRLFRLFPLHVILFRGRVRRGQGEEEE
jgi:hypothetical protein